MRPFTGTGAALCLLLAASCSDSSDPGSTPRESNRDARYCEFTTLFLSPDGITSDSWNTSGLNDCPSEDWEALDFGSIRQELGATVLRENGPCFWVFDAGVQNENEDAEQRFFGNIEFGLVAHVQYDFLPPRRALFFRGESPAGYGVSFLQR